MRLIDADAALEISKNDKFMWVYDLTDLEEFLAGVPTVDAVEVVRCKDCESYIPGKRSCKSEYLSGCTIPDGYCFNGVRKKV